MIKQSFDQSIPLKQSRALKWYTSRIHAALVRMIKGASVHAPRMQRGLFSPEKMVDHAELAIQRNQLNPN